jgi:hypothetical protein
MYIKNALAFLMLFTLLTTALFGADPAAKPTRPAPRHTLSGDGPIVPDNWKFHKIGTMWSRVTNFGKTGDDAYQGRTPSGDWPGGSGNSYLYRGSVWLTASVNGKFQSSQPEDTEYAPIDSVHFMTGDAAISEEDTYTKYYDVKAPLSSGHVPLGLEVTERTFAWSESYRDDFIIYEFTIKNVGIDTDDDGYPDSQRDLQNFYFTYRLDGDVSKLPNWDAESRFCNQDDIAACNKSWDFISLFPQWVGVEHGLTQADADSTMMIMWDGDNPDYPADNGADDDTGNPGPDGTLQTPGFLGIKILKTEAPGTFKVSSFHTGHIYNDPATDQEAYDRMMKPLIFEDIITHPVTKKAFPNDYRGFLSIGPLANFPAGDSVKIIAALGVGCDPDRGGIYSLVELVKSMNVAQIIVDANYEIANLAPASPGLQAKIFVENKITKGVKLVWDNLQESNENFAGYKVWRSFGKTAAGAYDWQPLGMGTYTRTDGVWPPPEAPDKPGYYQLIDANVTNGFDYYYSVQSFSIPLPDPFGVMESNIMSNIQRVSPANPVAADLSLVKVVPNPYIGSARWNNSIPSDANPWQHRLQFINLPADATIKIFTLDGDFVDEIQAGDSVRRGGDDITSDPVLSVAEWDLITRNNQEAAPGIYLFVVDSPTAGQKVDKFVIVR